MSQLREFLTASRNDGNKVYEILAVSKAFMGVPLALGVTASSVLANGDDVYVTVRVTIDAKKHVAPISSNPIVFPPSATSSSQAAAAASQPVSQPQ